MRSTSVLICLLLLVVGCSTIPVTDGYSTALPAPKMRVLIWGTHPSIVNTTTTWLNKRGISAVEQAKLRDVIDKQEVRWLYTLQDESVVLNAAKKLAVNEVVFLDQTGDVRSPMVTVRGVDVQTAHIQWSGTARYPSFVKQPLPDLLADLTCQALATAWGERQPGTKWFYSSQDACMPRPDPGDSIWDIF